MAEIILLAESGSDITPELADQYKITIVPMHVTFGGKTYDDGFVEPKQLIDHYYQTKELPKTSGCTPHDFEVVYDRLQTEHPDAQLLYLAYSAITTCSYQSALLAAEGRSNITAMDTQNVTIGQGAVAIRTAEFYQKHPDCTVDQLKSEAEALADRVHLAFIPDTLEFLHAGGRVSNAAYMGGRLLNIHPCIELKEGKLVATKKYRGNMKKLVPQLIRECTEKYNLERERVWMVYVEGFSEELKELAERTLKELGYQKICWIKAGSVITSHGGPGAFGITGFSAE